MSGRRGIFESFVEETSKVLKEKDHPFNLPLLLTDVEDIEVIYVEESRRPLRLGEGERSVNFKGSGTIVGTSRNTEWTTTLNLGVRTPPTQSRKS